MLMSFRKLAAQLQCNELTPLESNAKYHFCKKEKISIRCGQKNQGNFYCKGIL